MNKLIVAGVVSLIGLTGCNVTRVPDTKMGAVKDMAPGRWTATEEGRSGVDRAWVKRFKDSKLESLVNEAVSRNPDMRVAAENVKQAQQAAYMAGASSRVTVDAGLTGNRNKINFVGFPFGGSQTSSNYGLNLNVNWEPDLWGRISAGVSASLADLQAVEMERRAAETSLAANVCKAWFALCEANEQLGLASEAHGLRLKTLEAVRDRFELALQDEGGGASELRLAETDVATSLALKAQRRGEVEAAQRRVELLAGRYPSANLKGRLKLPAIPSRPPAGLPSELLMRRPDIIAAERRYAGTGMRIKEAKRAVFPIFKLTGSTGTTTDSLSDILSSSFGVWSIGSNISQNILTGGLVKGEISTRSSLDRQNLAQLQSTVLKAFGEVESALAADKWLARRITEMGKAQKLADDAARSSEEDYALGNVTLLTVLTAQNRKIDIASQVALLRRLQLENRVNLHLALGGEFRTQKQVK
ncbi:MAG: efflux transporter outer membrane subunit [Akkermansiaceae bacterium]